MKIGSGLALAVVLAGVPSPGSAAPPDRSAPPPAAATPSSAPPPEVTPDPDAEGDDSVASSPDPSTPGSPPPGDDAVDAAAREDLKDSPGPLDATEFDIGAGFTLNTGNTNTYQGTAVAKLRIRRGIHQSNTSLLVNTGAAAADRDEIQSETVSNQQFRSGYEILLPKRFMAFVQAQWRRDRFQGLDTRLNVNPGFGYYFLDREKHRLWTQLGYGFQYDVRTKYRTYDADDNGEIFLDENGRPTVVLDRYDLDHQARMFLATDNEFNEHVGLNASFEYLQSFLRRGDYILNLEVGLSAILGLGLSVNLNMVLRYENQPLPRVQPLDTNTIFSLAYKLGGTETERHEQQEARRARRRARRDRKR